MAIINTSVQSIATPVFLAAGQQAVTTIVACNVSTVTSTLSMFAVPYGGNAGPTTQILNNIVLPPGETFGFDKERFVLEDNDAFYAQASVSNAITVTVSSVATT
jgi:hypothetical protein